MSIKSQISYDKYLAFYIHKITNIVYLMN